jgi:hypothetical protein
MQLLYSIHICRVYLKQQQHLCCCVLFYIQSDVKDRPYHALEVSEGKSLMNEIASGAGRE